MRAGRFRSVLVVTVSALALAVIGGCTNGTAGPSATTTASIASTSTPTVDPDDLQAVAYSEAEAAYREYFDLSQEIRQRPGMEGWSDLGDYITGEEVLTPYLTWYRNVLSEDPEYRQTGASKLVSVTPVSYTPPRDTQSDGSRQVVLDVCTDNSSTSLESVIGEVMSYRPPLPERLLVTYTMTGVPLDTGSESDFMAESRGWWVDSDPTIIWMVSKVEILEGESC